MGVLTNLLGSPGHIRPANTYYSPKLSKGMKNPGLL